MPTQKKPKKKAKQVRFDADALTHNAKKPCANETWEKCLDFTPPRDLSHPLLRQEVQAKSEPVTSKYVMSKNGKKYTSWVNSVRKEFAGFITKEALRNATPEKRKSSKPLPCTMVFCKKPTSKSQRQERQLRRPVIKKSRICICGNF
eukprot:2138050-Amphidinium_carterae.1